MKNFRRNTTAFALSMLVAMLLTTAGTTVANTSTPMAPQQQAATVGGDACSIGAGFSVSMGIAGLFGCVVCGVGSVAIDIAEVIWC